MKTELLRSTGPLVDLGGEISIQAIQAEFPQASDELASMMMHGVYLITRGRRTRDPVKLALLTSGWLPTSRDLNTWFNTDEVGGSTQLVSRCPEVNTLMLVSNRLGTLVKSYQPHQTPAGVMFSVPQEDLRSAHSTVVAVVPIPDTLPLPL